MANKVEILIYHGKKRAPQTDSNLSIIINVITDKIKLFDVTSLAWLRHLISDEKFLSTEKCDKIQLDWVVMNST